MMATSKLEFLSKIESVLNLNTFRVGEGKLTEAGWTGLARDHLNKVISYICDNSNCDLMTDPDLITTPHTIHIRSTDRKFNWNVTFGVNKLGQCFVGSLA